MDGFITKDNKKDSEGKANIHARPLKTMKIKGFGGSYFSTPSQKDMVTVNFDDEE